MFENSAAVDFKPSAMSESYRLPATSKAVTSWLSAGSWQLSLIADG
jgi:hypothetical protein